MSGALRRYAFSERLADILGQSRRDLRVRVTLMITDGLISPGARGPGAPPATADYAADLLIGVMAAPQQVQTVDAIRCYRALKAGPMMPAETAGVVLGTPRPRSHPLEPYETVSLLPGHLRFGEALARLIEHARNAATRETLARELFGIWISRGFPAAAVQLAAWREGRRTLLTRRYQPEAGAPLPGWLDPDRGGLPDSGLFHTVFLPVSKLIEIGALTSPPVDERTALMLDLGQKIANLAQLARERHNRRPWEKFLAKAAIAEDIAERIDARDRGHLTEVTGFGSNPGNLRMLTYLPDDLPGRAALVVVLHGCTQTAASYDTGTGWSELADRHGFALLLPEQRRSNNPLRCFNWFRGQDYARDGGEPESIRQMIERLVAEYGIDPQRIFVTGLSAGGAMTSVMLATHPELFAGGAVVAGVPYRCANGLQEGFDAIFQGRSLSGAEWGERVRTVSAHTGPWPRVQVWHGDADGTVKPMNADEVVKQWRDMHGLPAEPAYQERIGPHSRRVWRDAEGRDLVEQWGVAGMGHGQAIDPHGPDGCGRPAPFIVDAGISSPTHIARSWGLTAVRRERPAKPRRGAVEPVRAAAEAVDRPVVRMPAVSIPIAPGRHANASSEAKPEQAPEVPPPAAAGAGTGKTGSNARPALDPAQIIARSLAAAAGRRNGAGRREGTGEAKPGSGGPGALGIDIPGIIGASLEAAGLLKEGRGTAPSGTGGPSIAGVDIGAILSKSFEAAGLLRPGREAPPSAGTGDDLAAAGWEGSDRWQMLPGGELHGHASSGVGCDVGEKLSCVNRRVGLGSAPRLSYARKLELRAATNMLTTASFTVLIDGVPVDEVIATGMDFAEETWTERADIDLARFANRTTTLTVELSANSNVCLEVSAEAWLRDLRITEAAGC
jgi:feruloyl esterase